jgi:hypothetical protein
MDYVGQITCVFLEIWMVDFYTYSISNWRLVDRLRIQMLDVTVKSGDPTFAPSWEIVLDVRSGRLSESKYTEMYTEIMRESLKQNPLKWNLVASMDRTAL